MNMNKLVDGAIARFLLTSLDQREVDVQVNVMGRITTAKMTKLAAKLTHDPTDYSRDGYATDYDPAAPLVMTVMTYLDSEGNPVDKCPKDDRMRWAFVTFDVFRRMLAVAGYDHTSDENKYPLPGHITLKLALSGTENYVRSIGGDELAAEAKAAQGKLNAALGKPAPANGKPAAPTALQAAMGAPAKAPRSSRKAAQSPAEPTAQGDATAAPQDDAQAQS